MDQNIIVTTDRLLYLGSFQVSLTVVLNLNAIDLVKSVNRNFNKYKFNFLCKARLLKDSVLCSSHARMLEKCSYKKKTLASINKLLYSA